MPITGISSVWYPVEDWERAKQFYADILGLRLDACNDTAGWAAFSAGEGNPPLFLVRKPEMVRRGGGAVVGFEVTEYATLRHKIIAFGTQIDNDVQESDTVRIYTVYDPDGNALELSETKPHP